jgi:CDP-diacylglycerol--serine O-phosphatidyltransferase
VIPDEPGRYQPTILYFVRDPANLVTLLGLAFGMIGLAAAMAGSLELAVAFGIWAMVCDSIDGPIARRSRSRTEHHRSYGVQLDSLADIVCSTVLPASVLLALTGQAPAAVAVGLLLVLSGALRLAYFNLFGRSDGATVGLPVAYTPALIAVPLLFAHHVAVPALVILLVVIAVLQVLPVRVPDLTGLPMVVFLVASTALSVVLLLR